MARLARPPISIEDPADERVADYRNLNDAALRARLEHDGAIFVVEGRVAVRQLLCSSYEPLSLLVDDHQVSLAADLVDAARARCATVYVASRDVVAATVGYRLHRGVVAIARRPVPLDGRRLLEDVLGPDHRPGSARRTGPPRLIAVLEGVNDQENLGAIFRNAAAFGVSAVLMDPSCADPLYRRSVRVSVGHVLSVPFARLAPWPDVLSRLREAGVLVAALAPQTAPTIPGHRPPPCSLDALHAHRRRHKTSAVAVLLGAEGAGLSRAALSAADVTVSIPMARGVDSLNVATAAAIAFHELAREEWAHEIDGLLP